MTRLHYFFDLTSFYRLGQKYKNIFVHFFVQMKTFKFAFEIYWPLIDRSISNLPHFSGTYFDQNWTKYLGASSIMRRHYLFPRDFNFSIMIAKNTCCLVGWLFSANHFCNLGISVSGSKQIRILGLATWNWSVIEDVIMEGGIPSEP